MQTVLCPSMLESGATTVHAAATPARRTTTLYNLIAALQEVVGADDTLVVATVVRLLRSRRLTWLGQTSMPLDPSRRVAIRTRQYVCRPAAAERSGSRGQREEHTPQRAPHKQLKYTSDVRSELGWQRPHAGALEAMRPRGVRHTTGRLRLAHACPGRVCIAVLAHKEDNR